MDADKEANQLGHAIRDLINRYSKECDHLTIYQTVGLLDVIKFELIDRLEQRSIHNK